MANRLLVMFLVLCGSAGIVFGSGPALSQDHASLLGKFTDDFDAMEKRRLVRIIVPFSKTIYFIDKGAQYGTAVDFGTEFQKVLNAKTKKEIDKMRVAFVPVARDELITALNEGRGDIVMANLTITPARQVEVDFSAPLYAKASEVLVTGPGATGVKSLDDLAGKEIRLRPSSSYYEHLAAINEKRKAEGKPEITLVAMDENLEDEDLLEMVDAGLLPWTVVDDYKATIWKNVFPNLTVHPDIAVNTDGEIAWAIRKNSPLLKAKLDAFANDHKIGTTFGNILKNRFYKSDKMVRRAYSPAEMEKFTKLVDIFRKHAGEYSFDYLMVIAQGYQESQLDQSRRSPRGAVGIMQLLPTTAADKAVGIKDISSADRNVEAGNKYLRHLIDTYIADPALPPREQLLFAFAAYNAGPGNLRKFRAKAAEMGLDPNRWFGNVENGAAAIVGRETVQYVSNIYKYYIAYDMLAEHAHMGDKHTTEAKSAVE
ncbi:transporter substrate-binding domain-containing protein [Rhizobium sp. LjRoot98]|uniref:transglycosylase SLT domain-containing protein n=1 Tax=unclassified Rhizobium TaxID=2613769 RepID=UPI0007159BAB|nr:MULTISPECIES: transporter substrate-binding domain-containing protein [unclassified Rhizobium]KQV42276.1 transglycosylase [Rhizobium sp. Root1204]KQY18175.1 transglycosylase [Rhizobium sp. Root1334]KRB98476.1 transglycosylase [Rhizobium sp. Root73]